MTGEPVASRTNGHDALEEKLGRLLKKPGVKASIVLDRASGAILKTSGDVSALRTAKSRDAATAASFSNEVPAAEESESKGMEDFAAMVWNFVATSDQLVQEVDKEDELRLLRMRTKKQEIVIVPDTKYLLTVIHDTPSA
ncbi:roadblock/LC7 domain-containing protein [Hirsutella rhossiliensis]|uniref:Roadblock/LC7 domain-containing protein n=1 Tax=Hirsutella rhossiliensis TaxID=111463 RepID=A0A9P8MXG8_9HYPO|nr:roadblock/LC7 domain-containing protein [Hirsutella rhossiliensis]KAH0964118.1 roadblock/LC7 domain-containing protein [Hirsutella rhossiliensis]